jgi:hypothetical protein
MKHQYTFVISLVMLGLIALTACIQVSPEESGAEVSNSAEAFAPMEDEAVIDSTYLADNPELMAAGRYVAPVVESKETSGSTFTLIRVNPESIMTGRYGNLREDKSVTDSAFYAANPELITAHRYTAALEDQRRLFPGR